MQDRFAHDDESLLEEARCGDDDDLYTVCNTPSSVAATLVEEAAGVLSFIEFPADREIKAAVFAYAHVPHVLAPAPSANRPLPRVPKFVPSWVNTSTVDTTELPYSRTPLADVIPIPELPRGVIF